MHVVLLLLLLPLSGFAPLMGSGGGALVPLQKLA